MKIGQKINFVVISKQADSLYSLIADGQYRATSIGRDAWISLIGYPDNLQPHCNMEGFNAVGTSKVHRKARIGLLGNEQNDCHSCDTYIGFGSPSPNTCGNGNRKAMGYILVEWAETSNACSKYPCYATRLRKKTDKVSRKPAEAFNLITISLLEYEQSFVFLKCLRIVLGERTMTRARAKISSGEQTSNFCPPLVWLVRFSIPEKNNKLS